MISYAIVDSSQYSKFDSLTSYLKKIVSKEPTHIVLRDKDPHSLVLKAKEFANFNATAKLLLHSDYQLAKELGLFGVHLDSKSFDKIEEVKSLGLFCVISCHSKDEVFKAKTLGADMVTYSPIFDVPNKGKPKGLENLSRVCHEIEVMDILALGGITDDERIKACLRAGANGFASIGYFIR